MKKVSLQFKDVLQLLEFVEHTGMHHQPINLENLIISCYLSEADLELAVNGFNAIIIDQTSGNPDANHPD